MAVNVILGMSQTAELGAAALAYLDPDEYFVQWSAGETMTQMSLPIAALWTTPSFRGPNAPLANPTVAYFAVDPLGTLDFDADAKAMFDVLLDTYTGITDVHFWILVGSDDGNPGSPGENGFLSCSRHNTFQPTLETFVSSNPTYLTQGTNQVTINIHLGPEIVVTQPTDFVDELGHLTATGKQKAGIQFLDYLGFIGTLAVPDVRAVSTWAAVGSGGGNLTPNTPAGVAIGDWVEIFFIARGVEVPAAPTGWTLRGTPNTTGIDIGVFSRNGGWQSGDSMPTFSGLAAAAGAVSVAYTGVNLGFPYHIASRTQTAQVLYADHASALTVNPAAIGTANPDVLLVTSVATPDDNALAFDTGLDQGFTDEASGTAYQVATGPAAGQMAFMLASKSQTTQADAITQPTFRQTVNGADAWESSRHGLQGTPTLTREITVGQAAEAEVAIAITVGTGVAIAVSQAVETEVANPVAPLLDRQVTVGQAAEAETANAVTPNISREIAVSPAAESEVANPVTPVVSRQIAVSPATETESPNAVVPLLSREVAVGQASESETVNPITAATSQQIAVGQAAETETANSIAPLIVREVIVGQASESETANTITPTAATEVAVGQASESEVANPITPVSPSTVTVGQATERELVQAITPVIGRMVAIGQATETETGQPITPVRGVAIGRVTEIELARLISPSKPIFVPLQTAVEREMARVVSPVVDVPGQLGPAVCEVVSPSAECEVFAL